MTRQGLQAARDLIAEMREANVTVARENGFTIISPNCSAEMMYQGARLSKEIAHILDTEKRDKCATLVK